MAPQVPGRHSGIPLVPMVVAGTPQGEVRDKGGGQSGKGNENLSAKKVDLNGKRKRDDGNDNDSSLGSEMRSLMAAIDRE